MHSCKHWRKRARGKGRVNRGSVQISTHYNTDVPPLLIGQGGDLRHEYLAAEYRILMAQLKGRLRRS